MDFKRTVPIKSVSSKSRSKGSKRQREFVEGIHPLHVVYTEGPMLSGRLSFKPSKNSQGAISKKPSKGKPTQELLGEVKCSKLKQYINQVPSFFKRYVVSDAATPRRARVTTGRSPPQ